MQCEPTAGINQPEYAGPPIRQGVVIAEATGRQGVAARAAGATAAVLKGTRPGRARAGASWRRTVVQQEPAPLVVACGSHWGGAYTCPQRAHCCVYADGVTQVQHAQRIMSLQKHPWKILYRQCNMQYAINAMLAASILLHAGACGRQPWQPPWRPHPW